MWDFIGAEGYASDVDNKSCETELTEEMTKINWCTVCYAADHCGWCQHVKILMIISYQNQDKLK